MGFDNECILNIQSLAGEFFCPVCRMLVYPNEALQSQCTHLYCKPCLAYIVATTRACPYDGYLVTQQDSKPLLESNKALAETIGKIDVYCLYRRSGCTWQGSLSECTSHCAACVFGNSPVVCNRCAVQLVHRQVQEHAQTCSGVPSQVQTAEGTQSTNQLQATVQGGVTSSQAQAYHLTAAGLPGQVPIQPVIPNPLGQAALPVTDLAPQQQHYQQYAGYDPYQQQYQQLYQQQPHLQHQHQPQVQALPQQQQHQPPSAVHTKPHLMIHPQSHSHLQSHSLAQSLPNQHQLLPHAPQNSQLHPQQYQQNYPQAQAQSSVQLQHISQVHPRANFVNHYPSISHTHVDHSYHPQSQSGIPQQLSGYVYPQEGHYQQQRSALQVQNHVSQPTMNLTELKALNQQHPSVMASSNQHQIFPTSQQPSLAHHEHLHMLHHRPPVQAGGQPLAPQQLQQVPVTTHTHMHSQLHSNVPPPMARHELPHQLQGQIGRPSEPLPTYPVTNEGGSSSGLHKQPGTQNGSESVPNNMSAENIAATGRLEGKETSLTEDKPMEVMPAMSASGYKVPSNENVAKEARVNNSEELNSVGESGSALSNIREGDQDKLIIKRMDSHTVLPANKKDEVAGAFPPVLDSDRQMMVNASSYGLEGNASMHSSLIPHSRNSNDVRQPYIHHPVSFNEGNLRPASLKAGPDSLHAFGWREEGFRTPQDKEQGSIRFLQRDLLQLPRPPNMESELLHKQGGFFSSMPYERDSLGFRMIPRPRDKALYGLHHDIHLQPGAFPEDNRLGLGQDSRSAASMFGRHFGVHQLAPGKALNWLSDPTDLAFISSTSSNLHPLLHQGSFSGQAVARNAELFGHGSISSLGEVAYRGNLLLTENRFHRGDLELYENIRKRKAASMGWCRICKVDCDTVEGLDLHSQTKEHQSISMDIVLKIKQQNSKRQSMISSDFDPMLKKQSRQDNRI